MFDALLSIHRIITLISCHWLGGISRHRWLPSEITALTVTGGVDRWFFSFR